LSVTSPRRSSKTRKKAVVTGGKLVTGNEAFGIERFQ